MNQRQAIGVDMGGTKVLAGRIKNGQVVRQHKNLVPKNGSAEEVLHTITDTIQRVMDQYVTGIGIGVPSVVDVDKGIVYDVQNIPSWKEVPLKELMENKFGVPVHINNDANCFALGEKYFGKGKEYNNFVGLIVGTGMAAGIVINGQLYNGHNCGAGEFGTIPYLDHCFEYYACGQFFYNVYGENGQEVFERAAKGDKSALKMFDEMGGHLGNAIQVILYALDPEIIILGGSVSQAYPYFKKSLWAKIKDIAFHTIPERLTIKISSNPDLPVLGAAALYYDANA